MREQIERLIEQAEALREAIRDAPADEDANCALLNAHIGQARTVAYLRALLATLPEPTPAPRVYEGEVWERGARRAIIRRHAGTDRWHIADLSPWHDSHEALHASLTDDGWRLILPAPGMEAE